MKRILIVGPVPPPYGGIASVIEELLRSELASELHLDVFPRTALFPPGACGLFSMNAFRLKRFLRFFTKVKGGHYQGVHIHAAGLAFEGTVLFMLIARLAGVKVILHLHGTYWRDFYTAATPARRWLVRFGLRLPARIAVLYSHWARMIRDLIPGCDVRVIRNLIHRVESPDASSTRRLKDRLGLREEDFAVLTVGSVGWRKGSFDILDAAAQLSSEDSQVRFILVGGEEHEGDMERLVKRVNELGLSPWVTLEGEIERKDMALYYALADLFLLPSHDEGMPMAILEAMQRGIPIVSTPVGAIPEVIEDGVSGILIPAGAPRHIREAVSRLRNDPLLRERIADRGKAVFDEGFEFSAGIRELRSLYEIIPN